MGRAKTSQQIAAEMREFDEKVAAKRKQLKERQKAAKARESAAERRKRNHALITMGAWLESACGGDWKTLDYDYIADTLKKYEKTWKKAAKFQGRTPEEADEAVRAASRERAEKAAKARAAAEMREIAEAEALAGAAEAAVADAVEDLGEPSHKRGIDIEALCGLDVDMDEDD